MSPLPHPHTVNVSPHISPPRLSVVMSPTPQAGAVVSNEDLETATPAASEQLMTRAECAAKLKRCRRRERRLRESQQTREEQRLEAIRNTITAHLTNYEERIAHTTYTKVLTIAQQLIGTLPAKQRNALKQSVTQTVLEFSQTAPIALATNPSDGRHFAKLAELNGLTLLSSPEVPIGTVVLKTTQGDLTFSFQRAFAQIRAISQKQGPLL